MLLQPGSKLGDYTIIRSIGKGGMGEVYLARDPGLEVDRAIKILPAGKSDGERVTRFTLEARKCAKLEHANIVTIHGIHRQKDIHYIVMQYVEGKNLAEIKETQGGPIPWRSALKIIRFAAKGMEAVHEAGLLHRDIKPSNIMVGDKQVLLMDFGLVRDEAESDLTADGQVLGTPIYMAPEQCRGTDKLDKRCDIYALGATLYFLLTGEHPYRGSWQEILIDKANGHKPPAACVKNRYVPKPVSRFVEKAMAFRRKDRFPDAKTFGRELQKLISAPDGVESATSETSQMSGADTAGFSGIRSQDIVPELKPILDIETVGGKSLQRVLPWALAVGGVMLLVVVGLLLNQFVGKTPEEKKETKVTTKKKEPFKVDLTNMVEIPAGYVRLGAQADTLENHLLAVADAIVKVEVANTRRAGRTVPAGAEEKSRARWIRSNRIIYMPSAKHDPANRVPVPLFWIDRYEVTNREYVEFVAKTKHPPPAYWGGDTPPRGRELEPVMQISYDDAAAYAKWAGKKLPTLAQWVRAFRGDKDFLYPWGNVIDENAACTSDNPKYKAANGPSAAREFGRDSSIAFGVRNLAGNVGEFVREKPIINGRESVLIKGGDWMHFSYFGGIASIRRTFEKSEYDSVVIDDRKRKINKNRIQVGFRCVYEPASSTNSSR